VPTISFESELSGRTVDGLLKELVRERLIEEQAPPRQHRPRTYRFNLERVKELAPPEAWEAYESAIARGANSMNKGNARVPRPSPAKAGLSQTMFDRMTGRSS
jgi:hypothetical protein